MTDLAAAVDRFGRRALSLDGVHVLADGHEPVERRWTPDLRRDVFSASKTVVSIAVGVAVDEGLFTLDDPVLTHLGHLATKPAPGMDAVTVRQLLTMTSGIGYRWADPDADHPGDPAHDILTAPLAAAPGSAFAYRGANSYLLSRLVHATSGVDLRDYLLPRVFAPLGIANPQWHRCPLGFSLGATGLQLRTGELARVGRALLDGGALAGRQVVPRDYVAELTADPVATDGHLATGATEAHPDNARYGLHAWLCSRDDAWRLDGIYGQFAIVLPRHRACVTVTAHHEAGPTAQILDAVWTDIVPALS